jgi:tetrapyrrole methylase family protein/MazG family protein
VQQFPHWKSEPQCDAEWFLALRDLAVYLRSPEGCPWDQKQSGRDFAAFLADEGRELVEAFDKDDNENVEEELGDCLFTLLASIAAAEQEGRVQLSGVLKTAHEKMIRRHQHVFGKDRATTPEEAVDMWNRVKAEEKRKKSEKD